MTIRTYAVETKVRKVTPPSPSYMSNEQFSAYLGELRDYRASRPGRPKLYPDGAASSKVPREASAVAGRVPGDNRPRRRTSYVRTRQDPDDARSSALAAAHPTLSLPRVDTSSPAEGSGDFHIPPTPPLELCKVVPSATYMERGQRWMEKKEATSIRHAIEDLDLQHTHTKVGQAGVTDAIGGPMCKIDAKGSDTGINRLASQEAARLMWQHKFGRDGPSPGIPPNYRSHLRKNSYADARSASILSHAVRNVPAVPGRTLPTPDSSGSLPDKAVDRVSSGTDPHKPYKPLRPAAPPQALELNKVEGEIRDEVGDQPDRKTSSCSTDLPTRPSTRRPLPWLGRKSRRTSETGDIHLNAPSQSRNPEYRTNAAMENGTAQNSALEVRSHEIVQATSKTLKDRSVNLPNPTAISATPGRPIVSFDSNWKASHQDPEAEADVRQSPDKQTATRVDLRRPPGREGEEPVSTVDLDYINTSAKNVPLAKPVVDHETGFPAAAITVDNKTRVPTIQTECPGVGPDRQVDRPHSSPSIVVDPAPNLTANPLPAAPPPEFNGLSSKPGGFCGPSGKVGRPLPSPSPGRPMARTLPRGNLSARNSQSAAICHSCRVPIEGRVVGLGGTGERFHPHCFKCFACGTLLEALEISPEPEHRREERLERIRRRALGEILPEEAGRTVGEDGDERLRFFCHLDWHELFAPRCKHCKTPILGEHIVALGHHWHYGHFFCAECGDPFEQDMTHIEKDGYAWCVNCQTKMTERRAPKCRKCKKGVVGQYVRALGSEWHNECFRCATCNGSFSDGQIFPRRQPGEEALAICTRCRQTELKTW